MFSGSETIYTIITYLMFIQNFQLIINKIFIQISETQMLALGFVVLMAMMIMVGTIMI